MEQKEVFKKKVHNWLPFIEARAFVRKLELKSHAEWVAYCKSGKKPPDIPAYPLGIYRAEYQGTDDWLGTGRTRKFRSFTEARAFVRRLDLKGYKEWIAYCKSGRKPPDIPTHPDTAYWLEFEGVGDWLGTGKLSTRNRKYRPFIEARAFVRKLELKSHKDWQAYSKSGKRPHDIPSQPWRVYTSEYKDMSDWLGVELTRHYRPFIEARAFVRKLELKSHAEWVAYCKSGKKPPDIPLLPNRVYRSDYKGINDWLGAFRSFTEARAFVHRLELNTSAQWRSYCKSGKKPPDIPATPMKVYIDEYKSMGDWLGTTSRWDSKALLAFLFDLRPQLDHLEKRELYDLLQQNGAFTAFRRVLGMKISPKRVLRDLKDNNGKELEQALRNTLNENIITHTEGTAGETMSDENISTKHVFEYTDSRDNVPKMHHTNIDDTRISDGDLTSSSLQKQEARKEGRNSLQREEEITETLEPMKVIKLFFSYAHKDRELRDEFEKHLNALKRSGHITMWYDREIFAGTDWKNEIDRHLNSADIVLLLISADFISSDYCWGVEMSQALERHKADEAHVIPIILRPCEWQIAPFAGLQVLPTNRKPVIKWRNRDDAFTDIVAGIYRVVKILQRQSEG